MSSRILLPKPVLRRLYEKVTVDLETGCWNWSAFTDRDGYGRFYVPERGMTPAHKVTYEHFIGPVPEGLILGHYKQGDKCTFHEHVRPITHAQNSAESDRILGDVCREGHLLTIENTYVGPRGYRE